MKEIHRERSAGKSLTMIKTKRRRTSGTITTTLKSCSSYSSFKFGSFILLAAEYCPSITFREQSLVMLSPVSEAISESNDDESPWPWNKQDAQVDHIGGSKDQLMNVELDNNPNNLLGEGGGGGGGEGSSNEDDNQQLVLKLNSFGVEFRTIVGSCNGLVCLSHIHVNKVSLWNPNTKEHRILPKPKKFGEDWKDHLVAFGFDVETKDYKVVQLNGFESMHYRPVAPIECLCRVQVYSLSTDSWRLLEGIISLPGYPFLYKDNVLYLNGSCFFLAQFFHTKQQPCFPESDRFIISFDFTKEIFTPIQLPDHHRYQELYLTSLGDKIALFIKSDHNAGTCEEFNIWLLKEHGSGNSNNIVSKESWTKLHFFQIKHEIGERNVPIGLSNDGQFAFLETQGSTAFGKKVKLYHLLSKEVKRNFLSCSFVMSQAHAFKPSLVSIIGGNGGSSTADKVIGNGATNL